MRNFILGVVFALVLGGLYLGNPSKEDFARYYADKVNAELAKSLGLGDTSGSLGDFLGGLSQNVIQEALKSQVKRENYVLASVFSLPATLEDKRVLGIAGQYFSLN